MAKALKRMMVAEYEEALGDADGLILLDCGPMTVETNEAFRRDLAEKAGGATLRVVHNRTVRIVLERGLFQGGDAVLDEALQGPSAVIYGGDGPISVARVLREWKRRFKKLRVKGGVSEGEVLGPDEVDGLADLPTLDQMRAMLLSTVLAPARGIAGSLQAVYGGIARALQAHIDQQEDGAEGGDDASSGE